MSKEGDNSMDLIEQLKAAGWEVREGDNTKIVPVSPQGLVHCVDGREGKFSNEQFQFGPKIQGGVFGVAALMGRGDREGLYLAIQKIKRAGFIPSVHTDHHGPEGCGFARLWKENKLTGLPELELSLEEVGEMVKAEGGVVVELEGAHAEQTVRVNMIPNTTLVPDGLGFTLDLWAASLLELDSQKVAENAIETVQKLNGPKIIELFQ